MAPTKKRNWHGKRTGNRMRVGLGWVGLRCTVLYCVVLCCTVLYCVVLCCTVLLCYNLNEHVWCIFLYGFTYQRNCDQIRSMRCFRCFSFFRCRIHRADSIKALEDEKKRQEEARLKEEQAKLKEEQAKLDQVSSVSSFDQLFCLAF